MNKTPEKEKLLGKTLEQLKTFVEKQGWPLYTAKQIANWLYKNRVQTIDEMTNLSKTVRAELMQIAEPGFTMPSEVKESVDGTKKYLFRAGEGQFIETVYIPESDRHTLCVSSQAGCRMGCRFCMTARQGLKGQLSAGEILNQISSIPEHHLLTNIVYMGMGEPLDNLQPVLDSLEIITADYGFAMSPRRITVSTIGLLPAMETFLEKSNCHLAVSLHSPFDEERKRLVPAQHTSPLESILEVLRQSPLDRQRRVSFEYIVFKDLNHNMQHVKALARRLQGIRCRINLIRFHPIPGSPLETPNDQALTAFKEALESKGLTTTIRRSRGQDIDAACGLLSTKKQNRKG